MVPKLEENDDYPIQEVVHIEDKTEKLVERKKGFFSSILTCGRKEDE